MNFTIKKIPLLIISLLISLNLFSTDIPDRPIPPRLVNDFAGILDKNAEKALEWQLRALNDSTSNQILILTVKSLNGYDPASFAIEVGEKWKVGQKGFDNGIVVLVKPKYGNERGKAFIAVGYGLEGTITDALAKRIVENEMIPYFRNNDYETGILNTVNILSQFVSGEINEEGYNKSTAGSPWMNLLPLVIFLIIFFIIRANNARSASMSGSNLPFLTALWLGSSMGGGSHSGNWGNFTGGSSGSGGFGGGFSGFGGGSFGGGGAGGSW